MFHVKHFSFCNLKPLENKALLKNECDEFFSNMSKDLIEDVKENFVGYTEYGEEKLCTLIDKSKTINELLHICHSYIMNNERILESITELGEKKNDFNYPIKLYGEKSEKAEKLFEEFPLDLDVGWTDIVSVQNQIIMMVRDRGHALTLYIDTSHDKPFVKYFVPKICNEDMVKLLPGIDKSNLSRNGASGCFECEEQDFFKNIFSFIEKVPTDSDMPFEKKSPFIDTKIIRDGNSDIEETPVFQVEDIKELTVREGKDGRKFRKIKELGNRIARFARKQKQKAYDEKGGNIHER